jgi:hypothetical protein
MENPMENPHSVDERAAASAVAALAVNGKRVRETGADVANDSQNKIPRFEIQAAVAVAGPVRPPPKEGQSSREIALKPYPYFYYRDFSTLQDPDALTPLTAPGRVPNFPAKMHSILSRPDLADVVAWMPHGRSWRVLKPREFEIRVIPTYFEHAKFSSFIRQANGWGFRRITQGRDRNSYYHELFLRGLPHLCKMMKRPGVSEKQAADPEHEPDFYGINAERPVPEKADDESILLQCTLQGGPKARMPIYFGSLPTSTQPGTTPTNPLGPMASLNEFLGEMKMPTPSFTPQNTNPPPQFQNPKMATSEQMPLNSFQQPIPIPDNQIGNNNFTNTNCSNSQQPQASLPQHSVMNLPAPMNMNSVNMNSFTPQMNQQAAPADKVMTPMAAGNQLTMAPPPNVSAAFQASSAATQFAAGFAAATALSHQQFRSILGQALASFPTNNAQAPQQFPQPPPPPNQNEGSGR